MREVVAMMLSVTSLTVLPIGGLVGGAYSAYEWTKPSEPVCGLFVIPQLMIIGLGIIIGFGCGLVIGWYMTLGILRWANRCSLSEVAEDDWN